MLKLISSSIIFLALISTCHPQEEVFVDILSTGYEILQITGIQAYDRIVTLWTNLLTHFPHHDFAYQFVPDVLLRLLNIREWHLTECTGPQISRRGNMISISACTQPAMEKVQVIKNFNRTIGEMNKIVDQIHTMFVTAFTFNSLELGADPSDVADELYHLINRPCSDTSTCFFHQIAGKHPLSTDTGRIRTPSGVRGEVYFAYLIISFHLLKGYATRIHLSTRSSNTTEMAKVMELSQAKFLMHTHRLAHLALSAMEDTPLYIVREEPSADDDPSEPPYIQLRWYISQIIVNVANLNANHTCSSKCESIAETTFHEYGPVPSQGTDLCLGTISHCYRQELGYLYPAKRAFRRYEGVRTQNGRYGNVDGSSGNVKRTDDMYHITRGPFDICDICTCLCDDHANPETIRTFSLRPVTSNIEDNMVITGLRLVEMNGTIYIQIQQGKLEKINVIKNTSWVPVNTFNKSASPQEVFTFRYPSQNRINLDTISVENKVVADHIRGNDKNSISNSSYLVTGVRFLNFGGSLIISIQLTAWHPKEQFLIGNDRNWLYRRNKTNRRLANSKNSDVPSTGKPLREILSQGDDELYVEFTSSSNSKDFGQTTVPFLDGRAVVTDPPMPLSGAGLYYKSTRDSGGVIGLKLVSIDFSKLIATELN